jgi:hypothetical protein
MMMMFAMLVQTVVLRLLVGMPSTDNGDKGSTKDQRNRKDKSKVDRGSNTDKVSDKVQGIGSGKGKKSKHDKYSSKDQGNRKSTSKDDKGTNKVKDKGKDDRGSNKDKVSDKGEGKGSGKGMSKDDKGLHKDQGNRKGKSKDDKGPNKEGEDKGVKRKREAVGGGIQITVDTGAWADFWTVDVKKDDEIKIVKSKILKTMGFPRNLDLVLEYKHDILEDTFTLLDYHVEAESRLHMCLPEKSTYTLRG